ncbi:putative mitochondrial inner membrane translocase subunit TIM17 [Cardiosporidium cionae]|uniref:Mitochondrial inner membrane translocase subunit TIM17 n=1 Tax=Cardiosporidium cionae TaxID=476202 RepID=A0ABQ7JCJ9_9APIC|nr:putative mitochondrial inner membrane translocase subunit TIM17 [Cardiosporidium cionae]|eukprot:KAF8821673.1 putative mitochondrial inner membrane translocase subunit TIM17 [Cardiosporidium cionae]
MDDYLNTGGVRNNLEILTKHGATLPKQISREELYLQGYGRQWGEKLTYSMGLAYGAGELGLFLQVVVNLCNVRYSQHCCSLIHPIFYLCLCIGGTYGLFNGLRQGGATPKLFVNRVLNSCTTYGPGLANQTAVISLFYYGFNNILRTVRGSDDEIDAAVGGLLAGGLYKITTSWRSALKYSATACVLFSAVDYGLRRGYI